MQAGGHTHRPKHTKHVFMRERELELVHFILQGERGGKERKKKRERGTKALAPTCPAFLWNILLFVLNCATESASQKTQICGASHTSPLVHVRHVTYDAVSASAHNMVTLSIIEWVIGRHKSHLSHGRR